MAREEIRVHFETVGAVERARLWNHEVVRLGGVEARDLETKSATNLVMTSRVGDARFGGDERQRARSRESGGREESPRKRRLVHENTKPAKDWAEEFNQLRRENEVKRLKDKKESRVIQSRLLAMVNMKLPDVETEDDVQVEDDDPEVRRFRCQARQEHEREKAEYSALLKSYNIELPRQTAVIDLVDSDDD